MKTETKVLFALSGILMIICGFIALKNPGTTLHAISLMAGILTLASGIATLIAYFKYLKGLPGSGSYFFSGIVDIIIGIIFLVDKFMAISVISMLFAIWIIVIGANFISVSFTIKKIEKSWVWVLILIFGILGIITGVSLIFNPFQAMLTVSMLVGITFLVRGIQHIVLIFRMN